MSADLDALLVHVYVLVDDLLPRRRRFGRPPVISDSELICLAVAQVLLDCPNERRFLRVAKHRLGHLFPYIPGQAGFNKRLRALAPQLLEAITLLARLSPSFCDRLRLLDPTPVPCAASPETIRRSALAGFGGYGSCRSHSRWFWGFRLYLLCSPDGLPVGFELAAANAPERVVAAELLERALQPGQTVIADKGFAGREFEQLVASLGSRLLRPDRKDEPRRFGSLGGLIPYSINQTISQRDSHDSRFRRGRSLPCAIPGLLAELGSSTTRKLAGGGRIRSVSQVRGRHS